MLQNWRRALFYAARNFNELHKMDSYPDYLDGLMGACVGYFRYLWHKWLNNAKILSKVDSDDLMEVLDILESSTLPKGGQVAVAIKSWAVKNNVLYSENY